MTSLEARNLKPLIGSEVRAEVEAAGQRHILPTTC